MKIDINSDLGEGFGIYAAADDAAIIPLVSSANIACGFHAGDPVIMDRTVRLAARHGVDVGAHVGYPDRQGFGRKPFAMDSDELRTMVLYQLGAMRAITEAAGTRLSHANFHGALGNLSFVDADVAEVLLRALHAFDRDLTYVALPGTKAETIAQSLGLRVVRSFLADRAYDERGLLVSRGKAGAMVKDPASIRARIVRLLREGVVETIEGGTIPMQAQSILLHSDTPGAVELGNTIRAAVMEAGADITPMSQLESGC
ncbi:5-oxoprolinase subunit PxpA [Aureimonas altamirensis]|uniref:LamB/YcsF family protein n=1 Tax=Aureimonas altamirensis TaxID=370622 RepID=UPI0020372316|nr:5-oxoprolinase subunit PxpA [Aureimonas altamirensis]MCM2502834.1 5-oxoprolinase subunit PxpA [Aureimonas altamirensis]